MSAQRDHIVVGGKSFTESSILAELMAQLLEAHTDLAVVRRLDLAGTMICHRALLAGEIDLYAEYTGTGLAAVLDERQTITDPLHAFLHVRRRYRERFSVLWLDPFGFANAYALAMPQDRAAALGITRISDLLPHAQSLRAGFSFEFLNRDDGWPGLQHAYGLQLGDVRSLEHGLAYRAVDAGAVDLVDAYSTDARLLRHRLRVLEDDRHAFPPYDAAPVVRLETLRRHPEVETVLARLAFRIDAAAMQQLNHAVEEQGLSFAAAARGFLDREGLLGAGDATRQDAAGARSLRLVDLLRLVGEHLALALGGVLLAALVAIPLGIAITTRPRLRQLVLGTAGVLQTIPSLALLALTIPLLGLGWDAALAALFLYALLPILRNTYTGIVEVDGALVDAARGMGMRPRQVLRLVQLPLALRTIMAGIRTSAVIGIGVATLAAFIGAGGLGEPIVTGLYLDDVGMILGGAVPAAVLAVLTDFVLARVERRLQPQLRPRVRRNE